MSETPVEVLVAGGGTVGVATAVFLAHHGVETLVVERETGPSIHPRATGVSQRTVELLREVGLEDALAAVAVDLTGGIGWKISADTLASADLAGTAATGSPRGQAPVDFANPVSPVVLRGTCAQDRLDSVLLSAARERGATISYGTELVSWENDADGVTAVVDGQDGRRVIRADYLVAADGARSSIRAGLAIPTSGPGGLGSPNMNILFRADLADVTGGRRFFACDITTPRAPGMLMTIDGEKRWVFHTKCDTDAGQSIADFTPQRCADLVRAAIGRPDLDVQILSVLPWRVRSQVAERFRDGRVFLVGDAAHTIPPLGAFGMNTGVADAHNLAWKLAYVERGHAGPALLDTYDAERRPVASMTNEQATRRLADPRLHWDRSPEMASERARHGIVHAHIVQIGYRYASAAVLDPQPELPSHEDIALDGTPGSRIPHAWLTHGPERVSTLDLLGSRFTLYTGADGTPWVRAAAGAAAELGIEVGAHRIAPEEKVTDPDGRWLATAGIGSGGALLVRPDGFIAWRAPTMTAAPDRDLERALRRLLDRDGSAAAPESAVLPHSGRGR